MAGIVVSVGNKKQVEAWLKRLAGIAEGPDLRGVLKRAVPPLAAKIRALAPVRYGYLAKATTHVERWYPRNKIAVSIVGAGADRKFVHKGKQIWPAKYAHLAEAGTAPHSLATAVDMRVIRRGGGLVDVAERDLRKQGLVPRTSTTPLSKIRAGRTYSRADVKSRAREITRDYLLRRDRLAGKRTHPGAKPTRFMQRAVEATSAVVQASISEQLMNLIRKAAA